MAADVWTQHNDNCRPGSNLAEDVLDWSNVNVNSFGEINEFQTKGFIWAQPLYIRSVLVGDRQVKDLILVATSENWLYAFDDNVALSGDAAVGWSYSVGAPVP